MTLITERLSPLSLAQPLPPPPTRKPVDQLLEGFHPDLANAARAALPVRDLMRMRKITLALHLPLGVQEEEPVILLQTNPRWKWPPFVLVTTKVLVLETDLERFRLRRTFSKQLLRFRPISKNFNL